MAASPSLAERQKPAYSFPRIVMSSPIDPILRDMIPEFLEPWKRDTTVSLHLITDERKADDLYRFGHTLVGSASQFGVSSLAEFGRALKSCTRSNDWLAAVEIRSDLIAAVQRLIDETVASGDVPGFSFIPSNL